MFIELRIKIVLSERPVLSVLDYTGIENNMYIHEVGLNLAKRIFCTEIQIIYLSKKCTLGREIKPCELQLLYHSINS